MTTALCHMTPTEAAMGLFVFYPRISEDIILMGVLVQETLSGERGELWCFYKLPQGFTKENGKDLGRYV